MHTYIHTYKYMYICIYWFMKMVCWKSWIETLTLKLWASKLRKPAACT